MNESPRRVKSVHLAGVLALAGSMAWTPARIGDDDERSKPPRAEEYGFSGLINSRVGDGVFLLQAADVDADGDLDLAVVNNSKARIEFLIQREADQPLSEEQIRAGFSVNELPDDVHFRRDSFPTEQKVTSLAIADLNGDARVDLAFLGDSGKLTVVYGLEKGGFGGRVRFDLEEPSPAPQAVQCGDLDGDGRADVLVLCKRTTHVFRQDAEGRLAAASDLQNATQAADGFALADFDGDRRADLLYVKSEADSPLRVRMNRGGGAIGPERPFAFTAIRSFAVADVDGDGRAEIAAVRRRSGRLTLLRFTGDEAAKPADGIELSAPRVVGYAVRKDEKPRDHLLHDLDGDGAPELIVAEPSAARVVVHRADPDGLACVGDAFPSLIGARHPRAADLDGDGRAELILSAIEEGAIGVAEVGAGGAIAFPEPIGFPGEALLAVDAADVDGDGRVEVLAVLASGRGTAKKHALARVAGGEPLTIELKGIPTDPSDLWLVDLNRDGLRDAMVIVPTELPRILLASKAPDGSFALSPLEIKDIPGLGILKNVARQRMHHGDVDGDGASELLAPGPNFARAFTLGEKGVPSVVAQWNLDDTSAKVGAVAAGDLDGDGSPEILLTDESSRTLRVVDLAGGEVRARARIESGDFEVKSLRVGDLDRDGADDVVLTGDDRFAVVQSRRADRSFAEIADFETPLENAFLDDLAFGDVNGDGIQDAVLTDIARHRLAIAALVGGELAHVLQFPVYEESIFERDGGGGREPREVVLADVTGDGKLDVAILVHDRVIVYPQE